MAVKKTIRTKTKKQKQVPTAVKRRARKKAKKKQMPAAVKKKAVKKKAQRKAKKKPKKSQKYALRQDPRAEDIGNFVSSEKGLSVNFPLRTSGRRG